MTREPTTTLDANADTTSDEPEVEVVAKRGEPGSPSAGEPGSESAAKRRDATQTPDAAQTLAARANAEQSLEKPGDPPVVARMVIEIRSDGSRTIARGAIEEVQSGEKVAIEAHGTTPMALAANLTKSLLSAPLLAAQLFSRAAENGERPRLFQAPKRAAGEKPDAGIRGSAKRAVRALLERRQKK